MQHMVSIFERQGLSQLIKLGICFLFLLYSVPTLAETQKPTVDSWALHGTKPPTGPIIRYYEPMITGCDDLKSLWGIPFAKLVLYSYWENQWRNIPYQLDDRLPDGRMVFPKGPQANPEDGNLQLDAKDELIFMIRDAGQRKAKDDWPETVKKGVEITIKDPFDKTEGFVYLFHIPDPQTTMDDKQLLATSDAGPQYIGGSHLWSVEGLANEHNGKIYKTLVNEKISTTTLAGGSGKSFLDRMKHRIEVRFLFGVLKLKLNESNMIGEVSQYRGGPLRLSIRSWSQITLPAKLKSPKMWGEVCLYETLTVAPIVIRVPFNPGAVITDFRMSMGYDLNAHAKGMKFYNSNNLNGFTVDGKTSEDEKNMNTDLDEWRCVTGPQGSLLTFSVWDKEYKDQANANVYFIDDLSVNRPPEKYPGQMGYFYSKSIIKSLEPRDYSLTFYICFPPFFYDSKGLKMDMVTQYQNMHSQPAYAVIEGNINKNRIACPEPLWNSFD